MQISGVHAVVTGAGSGLGAATARHLAGLGAVVTGLDLRGCETSVDITDEAQVAAAIDAAVATHGAPRIAVNCAGIGPAARIVGREGVLGTDLFRQVINVNLIGSYNVAAHCVRAMQTLDPLENGERGVVINTASIAYQDGQLGQSAYAASKGGIASMTLPLARELAKSGVRVMAIAPGLFHTPMMEGLPPETTAGIVANVPFPHRLGDPAEYALMAQQIIENPYLNGEVIRLDAAVRLPQR